MDSLFGTNPTTRALSIIRIAVATMFIIHGIARISLNIVDDFGGFLESIGLPIGVLMAWSITIIEIVGGAILLSGRFRVSLSIYFAIQLLAGIVLVHGSEGWFVVGAGRNGMEYSAILIICLLAVAYVAHKADIPEASNIS